MIIDKIENISNYKNIPTHVIEFVTRVMHNVELGRHDLQNADYANVETYMTKNLSDARFEAHKNYIDIQILLSGKEKIYYKSIEGLTVAEPYNSSRDIVFFADEVSGSDFVTLDGTNFMMIYPHEAHAPQVVSESISTVKKVVVKVKV